MTQETLNKANQIRTDISKIETGLCQVRRNFLDISHLPQKTIDYIRESLEKHLQELKEDLEKL